MFKKKITIEEYQREIQSLRQEQRNNIDLVLNYMADKDVEKSKKIDSVYINYLTKMGTTGDVSEHTKIKAFRYYPMQDLDNLYAMEPLIRKIINIRTDYTFKDEFFFVTEDKEYETNFREIFDDEYDLTRKIKVAFRYGLVHGDGFLLVKSDSTPKNSNYDSRINPKFIKKLDSVNVISRYFLAAYPEEIDYEFNAEYFYTVQEPLLASNFDMNSQKGFESYKTKIPLMGVDKIHKSHLLGFWGSHLMPYTFRTNLHFNDSYIRQIYNSCKNYNSIMDSIAQMMCRIPFPVYKMKGLNNKMDNSVQKEKFAAAMAAKEQVRAQNNLSVVDSEEEYTWYTPTLTGIAELVQQAKERMCMESGITHDVFFNEGSQGQTTGRSEKTTFQSSIDIERQEKIVPKIKWFMKAFESCFGLKIPKGIKIEFDHHENPTEKENAEIFSSFASAITALESRGYDCSKLVEEKYPQIKKDEDFQDLSLLESPTLTKSKDTDEKEQK